MDNAIDRLNIILSHITDAAAEDGSLTDEQAEACHNQIMAGLASCSDRYLSGLLDEVIDTACMLQSEEPVPDWGIRLELTKVPRSPRQPDLN